MSDEPPEVHYMLARAVLAALPFGGSVDVLVEGTRQRLAYKARRTVAEVVEVMGAEELAERLASEPEVEAVFVQGLEAAVRNGHEGKRRLLARLISAAVLDDAKVDETLLFVLALRDLDGPHLRALERLRRAQDEVRVRTFEREDEREQVAQKAVREAAKAEHEALLAALVKCDAARVMGSSYGGSLIPGEVSAFGVPSWTTSVRSRWSRADGPRGPSRPGRAGPAGAGEGVSCAASGTADRVAGRRGAAQG